MKKLYLILGIILILTGCGSYKETVQVDNKSYLLLIGEPAGNVLTIDNGQPINLGVDTTSYEMRGKIATKIQVDVGTHTIKIVKNGVLRVHRKFYVSNGNSFEVEM